MGLTEAWVNRHSGHVYAVCPGTVAGSFDADAHGFVNCGFAEIQAQMVEALGLLRGLNPDIKVLLTVSPVPLTATASGEHVLTATTYSKSVLRAVAGELAQSQPGVDYFPSYEIITAPAFGGRFFESNKRSVAPEGVNFVMNSFFRAIGHAPPIKTPPDPAPKDPVRRSGKPASAQALICEEEMLEAFSPGSAPIQPAEGHRIGIMGNSHLSALRRSFAARSTPVDGLVLDFWGLPGLFQKMKVLEHGVTHDDSERIRRVNGPGREVFDFRTLDGLVMMAEPIALPHVLAQVGKNRPELDDPGSETYRQEMLRCIETRVGMRILRTARDCIDGPLIAVQQPMMREGRRRYPRIPKLDRALFDYLNGEIAAHLEQLGVIYVPQPPETLTPEMRSIYAFSMAAADDETGRQRVDYAHMNVEYGTLVLDQVLGLLQRRFRHEPA